MPWIQIKPSNSGGGRQPSAPTGKLYQSGQLTISHATCTLLGEPERVLVSVEPELKRIRLYPTTPDHAGGFSLAGGGNSPHRIGLKRVVSQFPQMVGEYRATKMAGGVELRMAEATE